MNRAAPARAPVPFVARLRDAIEVVNTPFRFLDEALRLRRAEARRCRELRASLETRPDPLMVYTAPRTASTSIAAAIEASRAFTLIKVHYVQPEHFWPGVGCAVHTPAGGLRHKAIEQRSTRAFLSDYRGPVRVISMIRDPIAFNVSNFTYFGRHYWLRTQWRQARWMSQEALAQSFFERFPHSASSVWWEREFAPTVGFAPLLEPFEAERGWTQRASGRFDVLLMRADLSDAEKSTALRSWLPDARIPDVSCINTNERHAPRELAERLRHAIATRPDYVERMLDLPSSRRFWNAAQLDVMRRRWLGRVT